MKGLLKYSWIILSVAIGAAMVACNKSGPSANNTVNCPAGSTFDGANCIQGLGGLGAGSRIGFYAQTQNFANYTGLGSGGSTMNLGSGFTTMLRDAMGVCDRQSQIGGSNCGQAACSSWQRGYHDIVILVDGSNSNQAKLVIRSYPYVDPYVNYTCSFPSAQQFFGALLGINLGNMSGIYDPLVLTTTIWPANNNQGFELRANGPTQSYAWSRLFQLQVLNGKIEDPTINYVLYMDGGQGQMVNVASGTMIRCSTQNCGVTGL